MNEDSLRAMSLDDLIQTYVHTEKERRRRWWRALISEGHHPENLGTTAVAFRKGNPRVEELDAVTNDSWMIAEELERRGVHPESVKGEA